MSDVRDGYDDPPSRGEQVARGPQDRERVVEVLEHVAEQGDIKVETGDRCGVVVPVEIDDVDVLRGNGAATCAAEGSPSRPTTVHP